MAQYTAVVTWTRDGETFTDNRYSRAHSWRFDGGSQVRASASPHHVPAPLSDPAAVDPEEAFVAAVSSCHMLVFLYLAAKRGLIVDSYADDAVGEMSENEEGRQAITRVRLRPEIAFDPLHPPSPEEVRELHHAAHEGCYIANSIKATVVVEQPPANTGRG